MPHKSISEEMSEIVDIVATANGVLVGRTRLQKTACLLKLTGLSDSFNFVYKHYGPFSQELADATEIAALFSDLNEEQKTTHWGGTYSVFTTKKASKTLSESPREKLIKIANAADPVVLELVATAAFLASEGYKNAWEETANRKPEKVDSGRLELAKKLYQSFAAIGTPKPLPAI
jgi:uncharacterized protein